MKITQDKIHPDLVPMPFYIRAFTFLLTRKWGFRLMNQVMKATEGNLTKGLVNEKRTIKSNHGGPDIRLRIYRPENNSDTLPVLLYCHGGGYALGNPEQMGEVFKALIDKRPCVIVAPGYRRSLTDPYPAGFNDCYDTLLWIRDHADLINADPGRLMVGGHSAGGGLTAALTLKARDTQDVRISFQMPIYPMIDDRHQTESAQFDSPAWGTKSNHIGWDFYLKNLRAQKKEIPAYAAPARNKDYSAFPPTFTFVGGVDPFRDDTIAYVESLKQYNIPVKFKIFEGCYHGFEIAESGKKVSIAAMNFFYASYAEYYDTFISRIPNLNHMSAAQ
ncbi:MAG: alpha/beta hydrolase [Bacteroidota bacterium]